MKRSHQMLTLFSKKIQTYTANIQPQALLYNPRPFKFRSFFAFLKPKPFVRDARYLFCKTFIVNPRNRTLSGMLSNTKKFSTLNLQTYLTSQQIVLLSGISNHALLKLNTRVVKKVRSQLNFLLFKHKIYNYTTPKLRSSSSVSQSTRPLPIWHDFRIGIKVSHIYHDYPLNISTISTYNWKVII